jgi:hypothetical protein
MMEKLVQTDEGMGCTPTPFHCITITYKVVVYAPAEGELPLLLLYPYMYSVKTTKEGPLALSGGRKGMSSISWLTNSALVYEPKCGGRGEGLRPGVSANEYSCGAQGTAQINCGDLTPY